MVAVAMLAVMASWLVLAVMFFGIGRLVCRLVRHPDDDSGDRLGSFFVGWGGAIAFLQIWHLWLPVDWRSLLVVAGVGLLGVVWDARALAAGAWQWWAGLRDRRSALLAAAQLLLVVLWANLASGTISRFDSGLYHLQGVRWSAAYAIVPGLGNLHGRLAFNNSSFLYTAMLDVGPWHEKSQHLANGLLAVAVLLGLSSAAARLRKPDGDFDPVNLFRMLLFPVAAYFTCKEVSSSQPDAVTFLLGIVVSTWLLELFTASELTAGRRHGLVFAICLLSSAGVTVKLNFLPLGALSSALALASLCRGPGMATVRSRLALAGLCVLSAAILLGPWLWRGILLSGYPLYPSSALAADVPWRIPADAVRDMQIAVVGYARHQGSGYQQTIGNWRWVGACAKRELGHVVEVSLPLACAILAGSFALVGWWHGARRSNFRRISYVVLLPALATIAFVLATAPHYRFAGAALWCLAIGTLVLTLHALKRESRLHFHLRRSTLILGCSLLVIAALKSLNQVHGGATDELFPPIPSVNLAVHRTRDGLQIFVPTNGQLTWNAPLPSAPHPHSRLTLRREGDLAGGFIIAAEESVARQPASTTER